MTIARIAPGHGTCAPHHLALLSELPAPPAPPVWTDGAAAPVTAMLFARARRDALSDDLPLVDRYFHDRRLRHAAELTLGRERDVLAETHSCVTDERDHCLRTLVPILVRRALAHARLQEPDHAERSMTLAMMLIADTGGSVTPFLMLPPDEVARLLDAVAASRPDLVDTITRTRDLIGTITHGGL